MPPDLSSTIKIQPLGGNNFRIDGDLSRIPEIAAHAFEQTCPTAFKWFREREADFFKTHDVVTALAQLHESAWSLANLFYDQTLKESASRRKRLNLAHPAFGIAQLAQRLGHVAGQRHYSMIAQLGDVLGEEPAYRAGAFYLLSNRWGGKKTEEFISQAGVNASRWNTLPTNTTASWPEPHRPGDPIYPEALLAVDWLKSRGGTILDCAQILDGRPFVSVLLGEAEKAAAEKNTAKQGALFEAAVGLLLSVTPGFEVRGAFADASCQTDILALYRNDEFCEASLPEGYLLAECKHWDRPVDVQVIREFATRLRIGRHSMGLIVTKDGITGETNLSAKADAELVRHDLLVRDGIHMLSLSLAEIRDDVYGLRGLESVLKRDLEFLRFGKPT